MKKISTLLFLLFLLTEIFAQNQKDREFIISQTNTERLNQISTEYREIQNQFNSDAVPEIIIDEEGNEQRFSHFDKLGNPLYYALENESSAITSKIDRIRSGGSTGLDLDGSGIEFGIWEGGNPRLSHQEFSGNIIIADSTTTVNHATHIAGILTAKGVVAEARGMASLATIKAYTASDWVFEIPLWAAAGGLITNHSYIIANPQFEYENYGIYNEISQSWDDFSYNAPYLVMCTGASNNGNNNYNPDSSRYDLLATNKLGKNSIVVGACSDVLEYNGPESVEQAFFTSWGPTDDWRIKPDITAVGTASYSTRSDNDSNYDIGQGCSFSSPIVAGGLALLQQHYHNNNSVYMKAATGKALILSTTDEAGEHDGPDFSNGWGLFNAEKAAEVITNNGISTLISELSLNQEDTYSLEISVDGTKPLSIAICWNDPAAAPLESGLYNDPTPMLVNDLDVRVSSDSDVFYPWVMEPNSTYDNFTDAAIKGDNYRDNIEIISVENIDAGVYSVDISHKGVLESGSQDFSLIVNGIESYVLSGVQDNTFEDIITVFPNPVNDYLKIKVDSEKRQEYELSIYNITGQKQIESAFFSQHDFELNVSELPKGIYLLKVLNKEDNLFSTQKIIVQ